jgi:hypothetical protein
LVPNHFYLLGFSFCESALGTAVFDNLLVRPSVSTLDAADAAGTDVVFFVRQSTTGIIPRPLVGPGK